VTGALVAPERPDELAVVLDSVAAEPAIAESWGRAAHDRVSREYGLSRMVDGTVEVYAQALRRRR
jgi:glycosyltransferase involved in cell wall biosynthesis